MNPQQIRRNEALCEKLAAEYVLGTLRGGARRRFETWLREDAALRRTIAQWQDRLHPMAELAPAAQPSSQVWQAIEHQLNLRPKGARAFWLALREDLGFWRGLGMASTAAAVILATVLVTRLPDGDAPSYVATLADEKAQAVMVVTGDATRGRLTVKVVTPQPLAAGKSLELWALPKEGAPRSLGLVAADGTVILPLPENATPQSVPALAISLEPQGGSPDPSGPSGPVLFKGAWLQL